MKRKAPKKSVRKENSQKEQQIVELARTAWGKTLKEFYYPPLKEPNFVFDYTQIEGFYIDPEEKWRITMNLANAPLFKQDEEYVKYFHAISLHEVAHYQIIPYDGLINARLLKAAMKHVNQIFAPIVVNIFADLVIDTKLFRKHPELMSWELNKTYEHVSETQKNHLSDFSKFLFRAYEKMWDLKIPNDDSLSEMDNLVQKVTDVVLKDFEDETLWEAKVTKIAQYLKNLVNDTFTLIGLNASCDKGKSRRNGPAPGVVIEVPEDILEIMDNPLENKNSDKLKEENEEEKKKKAEQFARDTPYSEFGSPAGQAGLLFDGGPLATWYRGIAKNLIEIKIFEEKPGSQVPIYPEVWRIGDPIEDLDVVQSLLNSPVLIPNITTRKWVFKEGPGHLAEKQIPDLLIVIDSSGSMAWDYTTKKPKNPYHIALVASFASLHYAATKGAKFSVINFSDRPDICDWTNDYTKAEQVLLRYQGGGTFLPTKSVELQCNKAEKKTLVFIITDFGIYNWTHAKSTILRLAQSGHKIVGFFIGAPTIPEEMFEDLLDKVTFYPISKVDDLINLVVQEVKKYYN